MWCIRGRFLVDITSLFHPLWSLGQCARNQGGRKRKVMSTQKTSPNARNVVLCATCLLLGGGTETGPPTETLLRLLLPLMQEGEVVDHFPPLFGRCTPSPRPPRARSLRAQPRQRRAPARQRRAQMGAQLHPLLMQVGEVVDHFSPLFGRCTPPPRPLTRSVIARATRAGGRGR